jgi:hypothetical protein
MQPKLLGPGEGEIYVADAKGIFMDMERKVINTVSTKVKAVRPGWSVQGL